MQVTVTLSDGTGTQNIDGTAIVQAIASGGGSLLQVDQYNGSSVEILVDESPSTIATDTGNLLFSVDVVPVPIIINASFNYDNATTSFLEGERVFIGNSYGEIIALTNSSMTLGNFVGNQLSDNDFLRGQKSLCTAQINGSVTYAYPKQQATYINVGRCQGLKPAVAGLSALNYIYASPKVEILYTTLTESQLNAASSASGGSGWALLGNAGTDPNVNFLGTTDGENLIIQPDSGNVGVGTDTPIVKFQVSGSTAIAANTSFSSTGLLGISDTVGQLYWADANGATSGLSVEQVGNKIQGGDPLEGASSILSINDFSNNAVAVVDNNGNVGIGTASPTEKLDVAGDLALSGTIKGTTLAAYDDDADAGVGGLSAGDFYQTTGLGAAPLNAAGIVMVKQ